MSKAPIQPSLTEIVKQARQQLCGSGGAHIVKADIVRKGKVHLQVRTGTGSTWYRWKNGHFRELEPARDSKLMLAERLNDRTWARHTKVLAYRPGKRLTLLDSTGPKPRIIKGFRRNRLALMVRNYELAHAAFTGRGVHAPEVIDYDRDHDALVMVCIDGERLALSVESTDLFHVAGEALRDFQDYGGLPEEPVFDVAKELDVIDHRAQRMREAGVSPSQPWQHLRQRLDEVKPDLPSSELGLAHRDLHDKQFVQQRNYMALLDFDFLTKADTALDAANLLTHLVLRQLQEVRGATQASIDLCGKKFLQGLNRLDDAGFWERLRFYQATTFARLAMLYLTRPQWPGLEPHLVVMGNRCLDDLERIRLS